MTRTSGRGAAGRSPATWCAGARRWPPSPAPGSGSPRASTSGSASRRCCTSPPTSRRPPTRRWPRRSSDRRPGGRSRPPASRTTSCRSGWSRSASACPATSRRRWRSAPSSATTTASCCSCSGPTPASGCTRPGGPTSGTRRPRWRSRRSPRRPASSASPQRVLAVIDGQRMGFSRFGMYMLLFHCRAVGGELTLPPAGVRRRRLVRPGRPARAHGRRPVVVAHGVRRDPRRRAADQLRPGALADLARC